MMKWFTRGDYATEMTKVSCFKFQFIMISTSIQIYESLALEEHKMNLYGGLEVARQMQQQQGEGHVNLGLEKDVTSSQENLDIKDGGLGVGDIPKSPSVRLKYRYSEVRIVPIILIFRMKSIAESVISHRLDDGNENTQRKILSQALKDAPYKRKDKPNKNLIHDDDQHLKSHLEKRLYNTQSIWRRLSNFNADEEVS